MSALTDGRLKMDNIIALRLLQAMIDYFEAGNKESDNMAKTIIEWDFENEAAWQDKIKHLRESGEWTGLRAPEAEIISEALRYIHQQIT